MFALSSGALSSCALLLCAAFPPSAALPRISSQRTLLHASGSAVGSGAAVGSGGSAAGVAWRGGGAVARAAGRVVFNLDGDKYACSGALVAPSVVVTAAHCVSDGAGGWATSWTFQPGYTGGRAVYGTYPARTYYVSGRWAQGADQDDDVAFVLLRGRAGPALPVSFGDPAAARGPVTVFGYPAERPFTGRTLDYCSGQERPDPYGGTDSGIACKMTEGDSGGPWLSHFNAHAGTGVITGVSSFKYAGQSRTLYSPPFGAVAKALYEKALHEKAVTGRSR